MEIRRLYMQPQAQIVSFALLMMIFLFGAADFIYITAINVADWWIVQGCNPPWREASPSRRPEAFTGEALRRGSLDP